MSHYVEFLTADGAVVRVESTAPAPAAYGMQPVGRGGEAVVRAAETFEHALGGVRAAAEAALTVLRDGSLRPDAVEIEFGVKLSAEAGALMAVGWRGASVGGAGVGGGAGEAGGRTASTVSARSRPTTWVRARRTYGLAGYSRASQLYSRTAVARSSDSS